MKRPEGFEQQADSTPATGRAGRSGKAEKSAGAAQKSGRAAKPAKQATPPADVAPPGRSSPRAPRPAAFEGEGAAPAPVRPLRPRTSGQVPGSDGPRTSRSASRRKPSDDPAAAARRARAAAKSEARAARRELRKAAAERRRYERAELKRFTRRQRARRAAILTTIGIVGVVVGLLAIAIFSPLLSLRTIRIDGAERVDAAVIAEQLQDQLGSPLALVDYGRIDEVLRGFPVIQSYSTETIPPGTIAVHIIERQPIVSVASPTGGYLFVDSAGVTVERSTERLPGVPLVTESGTAIPNPAFDAAVEVLRAMPPELRAQIDTITAKTRDDVTLVFAGTPQTVRWGSANDSVAKAELLAALRGIHGDAAGIFDVSAITNGVFRPL